MYETFKVDRKSISASVAEYIQDLITEKKFTEGQKLPSEREMAQKLNVSRNTVREAYKILAAKGYLTIKHGNGVFVSKEEETIKHLTSQLFLRKDQIVELFTIRKVLETKAVELAIRNLTPQNKRELNSILHMTMETLSNDAGKEELAQLDQKFHLTITRISGNSILLRIMNSLIDLLGDARFETVKIPGRAELSLRQHLEIGEAIMQGSTDLAVKRMNDHLDSVEESILLNKKKNGGDSDADISS
ncbi:hypothetical protein BTR22_06565 [Alkalihalophilus pseudofirmus]|uniref:FadR/GntR family transcriptional regulator n=1 Tax=Alkalihalophilus pseudofirmus TaxID=79885 RepID=UPI0009523FBC|nr:hypothetical protein BTR22_06565 [Alkalihalophilus pseudofirmus]